MTDAFGAALLDCHRGDLAETPVYWQPGTDETEDARVERYFDPPTERSDLERDLVERCRGRVADLGCGAGRHARYLQARGRTVVAADASPGAVAVARDRGVERAVVSDLRAPPLADGSVDSVLVFGTQVAAADSPDAQRDALRAFARTAGDDGLAVVDQFDPTHPGASDLFGYRDHPDPGFGRREFGVAYRGERDRLSMLHASPDRMRELVADTPWRVAEVARPDNHPVGWYALVLSTRRTGRDLSGWTPSQGA